MHTQEESVSGGMFRCIVFHAVVDATMANASQSGW